MQNGLIRAPVSPATVEWMIARAHPALPLLLTGTLLAASYAGGLAAAILPLAPIVLLLSALLVGRYPGEDLLARLAARRSGPPRSTDPPRPSPLPRQPLRIAPTGGILLALRISGRAPPATSFA